MIQIVSKRTLTSLVMALFASAAMAGSIDERVLIPITLSAPVPGAQGSVWVSRLLARNTSDSEIRFSGVWVDCGHISLCPPMGAAAPGKTVEVQPTGDLDDRPGAVIAVNNAEDVSFSLRVQDISRQRQTWGTEIPVVRETELRSGPMTLVGVPLSADFRNTLRVYEIDGVQAAHVRIRIFGIDPGQLRAGHPRDAADTLLTDRVFALRPPTPGRIGRSPGYLEIGDLSSILPVHEFELLAIEISPVTAGLRLWAFAAIVNNETQHLTLVTPQ